MGFGASLLNCHNSSSAKDQRQAIKNRHILPPTRTTKTDPNPDKNSSINMGFVVH
jgi:hypothetical protein